MRGEGADLGKDNTDEAADQESTEAGTAEDRTAEDLGGYRPGFLDHHRTRRRSELTLGGTGPTSTVRGVVPGGPGRGARPSGRSTPRSCSTSRSTSRAG